ncbi:MAG: cbb3-type cytochrome c oxidase subunit II [Opitutaceae bacterium]|nr:cbb3-type cytochrome c oxidase subunit II [Opitutaceae bacterium]
MNNGPLLFLGIFFTIAFSWSGIVLTNLVQQTEAGATQPLFDKDTEKVVPAPMTGDAKQGQQVYAELGCVYCHSQQVRNSLSRDGGTSVDVERNYGRRPNVARDYIQDGRIFLGTMRTGPDLRNVGQRLPSVDWHMQHLYNPQITSKDSIMPPFPFLFEEREIVGEPSPKALRLTGDWAPPPGYEVVPTARAEALVAYLLSLRTDYDLPEAPKSVE